MTTKSSSTSLTVLIILMLIITFPFWIVMGGIIIGLIGGLFGILFGVLGALLGGVFALIALPFKLLFGLGDWSFGFFGFHYNGYIWLALLIVAALIISKRKK